MYQGVNELPESVRNSLSSEDAQVWMDAYNSCWTEGDVSEVPPEYSTPELYWRRQAWMACRHLPSSRFVEPVVTTAIVDKEGDMVDIREYLEEGFKYINRGGVGSGLHSSKIVFTVWDMYLTTDEATGAEAIAVRLNFFRGAPVYDRAWIDFLKGRRQWSIRSTTHDVTECEGSVCYNVLHPTQWVELSNVDVGINPRTYVIQLNEHAKGGEMVMNDYNEGMCPVLEHYYDFKEQISAIDGLSCNIVDGGVILVHGTDTARADDITNEYYSDCTICKGCNEGGEDYTLIVPHSIDSASDFLHDITHLLMDEQEAIEGYHTIMQSVVEGPYPDEDKIGLISRTFEEIVADEGNHMGKLLMLIKEISPEYYASIEAGFNGTEGEGEAVKSACPVGQHQHPGVRGCHDIFRKHHEDNRGNSSDKLDLTNEDIDVPSIENMETSELQQKVIHIAQILTRHSNEEVEEYLSSTGGKEFVLMFLELKKRTGSVEKGDDKMEKIAGADSSLEAVSAESDESVKGIEAPMDVPSMLSTALTALSGLVAQVDGMNSRLLKLEQVVTSNAGNSQMDISQEILSEVSDEAPAEASPAEGEAIAGEGNGEEGPVESAESEEESVEESEDNKPPFLKEEGKESEDDSEDEDKDSEDEDDEGDESNGKPTESEGSDDKKESDETEDKKDKKPEKKDEDKDKEEDDKDKEKKKGNDEESAPVVDNAPVDAPEAPAEPAVAPEPEPVVAPSEQTDSAVNETPDTAVETPVVEDVVPEVAPVEEAPAEEAPVATPEVVKGEVDYVELALRDLGIIGAKPVSSLADVKPVGEVNRMKGDTVVVMPRDEAISGSALPLQETMEGIKGTRTDVYMDAGTGIDNKTFLTQLKEELK